MASGATFIDRFTVQFIAGCGSEMILKIGRYNM